MEEGIVFRTNANIGVDIPIGELEGAVRRHRARRRIDDSRAICRCPAASWPAFTSRWST